MRSQEIITFGSMLVVFGIIFGASDTLIGYSFIGAGVLLSTISGFKLRRKTRTQNLESGGM